MFQKILIANRGEIACRVIRTARRMGIRTVAVYSEADINALHVELADEAYPIGPAPARESYLRMDRILEAAQRSHAEAVHPGYGFLSENADFAEACVGSGIRFIGPPAAAIRAMGSKSAAKALMTQAGVPIVPGYHGNLQEPAVLTAEAERIGYPILIKASAGGGGKGMRIVSQAEELEAAAASARREAASAFGNGHLLLEKYLTHPRHIEIQVFADTHGNVISLFERDCSVQRRYQKVIEEAPAPGMDAGRRRAMGEAACAAARAVGYVNAGTVEFLVDGHRFYFMEMNTRLQVEHPVTEWITGLDLVEWQLRVAAGEALPENAAGLTPRGHAIEARIYAEDPAREFRPSIGTLTHLRAPRPSRHVRVDTGVRAGDTISVHYDPLIAKLIVWDETRERAIGRLERALASYQVAGVSTNIGFLANFAATPEFAKGSVDTGLIARHTAELTAGAQPPPREVVAAGVLRVLSHLKEAAEERAEASGDRWSPWNQLSAWRMNGDGYQDLVLRDSRRELEIRVYPRRDGTFDLDLPDGSVEARALESGEAFLLGGVKVRATVVLHGDEITVFWQGQTHLLRWIDRLAHHGAAEEAGGSLTAPMPGRIVQVLAAKGAVVKRGAPLLVLEAMKMEYTISAPAGGTVEEVRYAPGDVVDEGAELIAFTPGPAE